MNNCRNMTSYRQESLLFIVHTFQNYSTLASKKSLSNSSKSNVIISVHSDEVVKVYLPRSASSASGWQIFIYKIGQSRRCRGMTMKLEKSSCALGTEREVSVKRHTVYFSNASLKLLLGITGVRQQQQQQQQRHLNCTIHCSLLWTYRIYLQVLFKLRLFLKIPWCISSIY